MYILLLLSILPSIIIALLVYNADKVERESIKEVIKAFLLGIISVIIALVISYLFKINKIDFYNSNLVNTFIYSFLAIALVEELSKFICGYFFLKNNKNYNYMFDGIVYFTFIGLGFATIENILYIPTIDINALLIRCVTTVPAHAFFGIFCGYYYSLYKNKKKSSYFLLSIILPIILHGFFDFCLLTENNIFFMIYIVFVVSLYHESIARVKKMEREDHIL